MNGWDPGTLVIGLADRRPYLEVEVVGRPATFATAHEAAWKDAVRRAVHRSGVQPAHGHRFAVCIEFRTPAPKSTNERWDLDNLVKATLDALDGVVGRREWQGAPQAADDQIDQIVAVKRPTGSDEESGARIVVYLLD